MNQSMTYTAATLVVASSVVKILNHYNVVIPLTAQEMVDLGTSTVILASGLLIMVRRKQVGDINLLGRKS